MYSIVLRVIFSKSPKLVVANRIVAIKNVEYIFSSESGKQGMS